MRHLEESHKQMEDDLDLETELEREIEREQEFEEDHALCMQLETDKTQIQKRPLTKVSSLPSNFTYSTPTVNKKFNTATRRQTVQYFNQNYLGMTAMNAYNNGNINPSSGGSSQPNTICESAENDNELAEEDEVNKIPIQQQRLTNRRNFLNKFKTQSFDAKYLSVEPHSGVAGPDDFKINDNHSIINKESNNKNGQSKVEPSTTSNGSSTINNLLINKKSINLNNNGGNNSGCSKKINYRQSSLDIDNRRTAGPNLNITNTNLLSSNNNNINNCSRNTNASLIGNKSYLSVPKLQKTSQSRSGSTKQLFKQVALDEDDHTNESSLLLPIAPIALTHSNTTLTVSQSPNSPIPSISGLQSSSSSKSVANLSPSEQKISIISSSSSSSSSIPNNNNTQQQTRPSPLTMQTLTVDDDIDGNFRKSESCELLRIISERRKV